jgi:hypothetical protein
MQRALEVALCGFGEQDHRMTISHHPVELEHVVFEVDVLEEKARSRHLIGSFGDRAREQPAQGIDPRSQISIDWDHVPKARDYFPEKGGFVETSEAQAFDLTEDPILNVSAWAHDSTLPSGIGVLILYHTSFLRSTQTRELQISGISNSRKGG